MNIIEVLIIVVSSTLILLLVVQWVDMVKQKKEKDKLVDLLNTELDEYKIKEETPLPMVKNIDYLILEKELKRYKPPYKVGQKVMYSDEGFAKVGYIHGIRTEQYEIIHDGTDKKEVVVNHTYEIGSKYYRNFYTDIIDVVKE